MKTSMKPRIKKISRGFTFIELLIGMVLIGVVAAMAVPRYVDAAQQELDDALWLQSVSVKNIHDIVTNHGELPSVSDLAAGMPASAGSSAVASGVQVSVSGEPDVVPTYTNALCTKPTKNVSDKVACVGAIAG